MCGYSDASIALLCYSNTCVGEVLEAVLMFDLDDTCVGEVL